MAMLLAAERHAAEARDGRAQREVRLSFGDLRPSPPPSAAGSFPPPGVSTITHTHTHAHSTP